MVKLLCLEGPKTAFKKACKPLIGVDECHLKSKFGGQLLIVVGRDSNDQYMSIDFAVVEIETKETWRWFLNLLFKDIGDVETNQWVFINDQQKVKKLYTLIVLYYVADIFWIIFMSYFMCRDYNKFFWNFQPR